MIGLLGWPLCAITTGSTYVPFLTVMTSPGWAAFNAAWIVRYLPLPSFATTTERKGFIQATVDAPTVHCAEHTRGAIAITEMKLQRRSRLISIFLIVIGHSPGLGGG